MAMTSGTHKSEIEDDADQWDWKPVEAGRKSQRALGAIVLAGSCLTLGVLIGMLSVPKFQRSAKFERTASDVPKNLVNLAKPLSEPSLALGGASETPAKPQEAVPVLINEGSAKLAIEQPHARDVGQSEVDVKEVGDQRSRPQDVVPKGSADHETMPARANLKRDGLAEKKVSATPAKARTAQPSFKDYRDLRNYALGK
jgi:hypothetical protein